MSTQPPSFTPPPRRRSIRSDSLSQQEAEAPLPQDSARPPQSFAPQRRSLRASQSQTYVPATADQPSVSALQAPPPAFLPSSMRQRLDQQFVSPEENYYIPTSNARPFPPQQEPTRPHFAAVTHPNGVPPRRRRKRGRKLLALFLILVVVCVAWPMYLFMDANRNLQRVEALSGAPDTPGTTFLLAGSDSRADGPIQDDTEGQRADSVMLLHIAPNGQTSAISLPRDTWVDIPEYGEDKLNASYALEGAPLLVRTVEQLTGLTVDHYVEIGMGGVANIVDAVGGVELCLDYDVDDELSELKWSAGCHVADGRTALAFSRMRYSDPLGDIGRAERQRQVVTKTVKTALSPSVLVPPSSALALERAGARSLRVDEDASAWDILMMVRAFRSAGNDGLTGAPPIVSLNYETYSGSAVLLQDQSAPEFFAKLREGTLTPADLNQVP